MEYQKEIDKIIDRVIKQNASDLHIGEGRNPIIRSDGDLITLTDFDIVKAQDAKGYLYAIISDVFKKEFEENNELDFSYAYGGFRFRGNAFIQQGKIGFVMRMISNKIKTIQELGLPPILETFARKKQGFFLVVGPVGQGKSTTLAAMIELINQERSEHIITIENPVEYVYEPKKSIIDQREVRIDTEDFKTALHGTFRQDVDVILVGEMRGPDTISAAVTAAETGHLVLSTLHTNTASQTIDRIIDSFPANQQDQIRLQLSSSLIGVFSQRLIPRIAGGMVPAYELLINTNAVSNLIREKRTHEIDTMIETGTDKGMIDMNRTLSDLVRKGEITAEDAYLNSFRPELLERII